MEKIRIYMHSENCKEAEILEIDDTANVREIVIKHHESKNPGGSFDETYKIFLEDEDDCKEPAQHHKECGIGHKSNVHCHRCEKIKLTLVYNNITKETTVSPSYTGEKILSLLPTLFGITEADAAELLLKIDDAHNLDNVIHVGTAVSYPHCQITLKVSAKKNVIG